MTYLVIFLVLCLISAVAGSEPTHEPDFLERIRRLEEKVREREEKFDWNTVTAYDDEDFYAH